MAAEVAGAARRRPARRGEGTRLRDEIVDAAAALVLETGEPSTLSLRAVARRVGIATTSIYLHFEDISALQREVKNRWIDELTEEVESAAAGAGDDPRERVRAIAHAYVEAGAKDPVRYRVLFSSAPVQMPPGGTWLGTSAFEAVLTRVRDAVPSAADAHLRTVQMWCALHGVVTLRAARPGFPWPDLDAQVDDLVDRLLGRGG